MSGRQGLVVITGKLRPYGASHYSRYLRGVSPLLPRHFGSVLAVGEGLAIDDGPYPPICAVLHFKTVDHLSAFFDDGAYRALIPIRNAAYEQLNLNCYAVTEAKAPRSDELVLIQESAQPLASGEGLIFG